MLCAIGLAAGVCPRPGWAAPPTAAQETTAMTDKARQLYEEGLVAFKKGKVLDAHASYRAAWSLNKHWQIAANLADTEIELGKYREAAEHAAYYQQHAPADRQDKAKALVNRARARVGALTIEVDPPGAEVLVDDVPVGRAPVQEAVFVDPGAHKVTARFAGRADATQMVTLSAGGEQKVALRMVVEAPPPPVVPVEKRPVWPAVVTGVLAAGGLAVGAGLTAAANGKGASRATLLARLGDSGCAHAASAVTADCSTLMNAANSQTALARGAVAGFTVGGGLALATAGLIGWTLTKPAATRDRVQAQLVPAIEVDARGITVSGTW
jgi:hypothetical protein